MFRSFLIGFCVLLQVVAWAQVRLDLLAGPQYNWIRLASYDIKALNGEHTSLTSYVSTGLGGHLGVSMIFGNEPAKGSFGILISRQHLEGNYVRSRSSGGHGGGSTWTYDGHLTIHRTMLEIPVALYLGGPRIHFAIGVSYWFMLDVDVHDVGTIKISSWNMTGLHNSTKNYNGHSNDRKPYVQHGPALTAGWMFTIKKRYIASLFYTRSFWDMYVNDRPSGVLSTVRLGLGYRLISAEND